MDEENRIECKTLADKLNEEKTSESSTKCNEVENVIQEEGGIDRTVDTSKNEASTGDMDVKNFSDYSDKDSGKNVSNDDKDTVENSPDIGNADEGNNGDSNSQSNNDCVRSSKDNDGPEQEAGNSDSSNLCTSCDNFVDSIENIEDDGSEDSGSDDEYESAEEGEEIHMDTQTLRELEESLTEEEKEEKRNSARVLKEEGNEYFRNGSYKTAIKSYSRALRTCPLKYQRDRAIMYSNRGACKMRLEDYENSIKDCSKAVELHPHYLKALMRRAELYEKTEKLDEALADFQRILELDPSQQSARAACVRLPDMIKERNEKMKEEMMGKLKELGNMVLRPFGLSTSNFKLNQDPNTGGYSVNFVQDANQNTQ